MFPELFSLKQLEEFIGRETILNQVRGWLDDGQFHPVFFSGEYGIGKTRLLQRILELEKKYDGAPARLIDLYHFRHHSPEGLARAIFACFENTENEYYFNPFITARRKLDEARAGGESKDIREQLQKMLDGCVNGVKKMSAERGVLLIFDTVEQFVYPTGVRFAPAWDWLKDWIDDLPRGAVFFAGRPNASVLFQNFPLYTTFLDFFTPKESYEYLMAVARRWSQETSQSVSFVEEDIQKLHMLSQGRPILLAIFLELRMRVPQSFTDLSSLHAETFEQKLIDFLLSLPELGETLKATGRAPKGINADLLSMILGIPAQNATRLLDDLKKMSFAKTFPDSDRIFLHDEMYYLLNKYVYSDVADTVDGQVASQSIYFYYKKEIKQKDEVLKDIFISVTSGVDYEKPSDTISDFVVKIRALESLRQELKTDFVFYRLRHQIEKNNRKAYQDDPVLAGLKNYYRFGHEAATSHDDGILIPLQVELVNFGASLEDENAWKPFIEGLMLIHKIWLKEATGQPYLDDISKIDLGKIRKLTSSQKDILYALLETWRGMELVFTKDPDYSHAENIYTRSIEKLEGLNDESPLQWFKDTVISLAYRQRAYTRRIRGSFQDAIEDFQLALYYNRAIDYYHEEATLRNDLGFAQMLSGQFQSAFENMWDGLQLRYRIAIGARISLSHSSLAQHFIATGAYEEARKHARYAIKVAGAVNYRRGLGFSYLAFAEATRRFAFSSQGPSNQSEYLQQAQDAIEIAILLLEGERARIIDAKLEQACLYRDRVRIELESSKRQAWFEKADKLLREVAREADVAGIYYRLVDAVSNRVWLGYYANRIDYAEQAIHEFKVLDVIESYWLINGKFVDEVKSETNPILWSRIGKYYMGRGVIALGQWKKEKNENMLHYAARYMMLGMMYSVKFGPDHRGLREGRRTIYQVLADLNPDELKTFCNYVVSAETIEKIPQKPSALQVLLKDHALWFAN